MIKAKKLDNGDLLITADNDGRVILKDLWNHRINHERMWYDIANLIDFLWFDLTDDHLYTIPVIIN